MTDVYLVCESYPFGPQEQSFLHAEVAELARRFRLTLLPFRVQSGPYAEPLPEGVRVDCLRNPRPIWLYLLATPFQRDFWRELGEARRGASPRLFARRAGVVWAHGARALRYQRCLRAYLRARNAEGVLYTFWSTPQTYAFARMRAAFPALRFVARAHGYDLYQEATRFDWLPYRRRIDEALDLHLFVCEQGKAYYLRRLGLPDDGRYRAAYLGCNGYAPVEAPDADAPLTLASCSTVNAVKRVALIAQALALWPKDVPARWVHFGDGPLLPELQALANELAASRPLVRVELRGRVPNAKLGDAYAALRPHALLNVSRSEGLPVSMMEALSAGIPLLGTDVGGVRELISPETGVLLPAALTPQALRDALLAYAREPRETLLARKRAARALWERRYRAEDCARRLGDALEALAAPDGARLLHPAD